MNSPLIETRNLKKYFKTSSGLLHAVDDVSLKINEGETLGVVGESGCGKSTLGQTIVRLIEPTDGMVLYSGDDILSFKGKKLKEMRSNMQMIFQDPFSSLNPRLSISNIIAEPMKVTHTIPKKEIKEQVKRLMEVCGLPERYMNTYPHELDGGRRQRVGLARALATNPKFIVCDEPVSALDVSIQAQILNLLMDLQDNNNLSYMFITHDLCVVRHISNYIMVMYMGEVVEYASRDEIFREQLHPYTRALMSAIPTPDLSRRNKERTLLVGEVTSPINPGSRCRFAPRCPYASEKCNCKQMLKEVAPDHKVACSLYE